MTEVDLTNEQRSQLELLAEEYVDLHRKGNAPSIEQFVSDHPELEDEIRELFPVMLMLDQGKQTGSPIQDHDGGASFSSEIAPGFQLGEYKLLQAIGRGGMGLVYEAEHVALGSKVAIKLLPNSLNRPKLQERFLREASAAARMNHPNIVRVFDYGKQGPSHYYVMSLVVGVGLDRVLANSHDARVGPHLAATRVVSQYRSLVESSLRHARGDQSPNCPTEGAPAKEESVLPDFASPQIRDAPTARIRKSRYLDSTIASSSNSASSMSSQRAKSLWEWVAFIGVQAADALTYAHEMGVIHRDVKPSNLMMDLDGKLFVTDFGLAKLANDSSLTETGDLLGTLRYLPPEALHGRADERGDIYGLGLTLYELLAGEPAFANVERVKLFHDISHGDIVPLHRKVPKIPRDLAQIIRKSIESDPTLRYADAASMRDDLKRFLSGEPIEARPASIGYRTSRWIARNRVISVLTGCLFLILAATAATAILSAQQFRDLAIEKEQETNAATSSARLANLNLLRVQLSDARGWATSAQVGQRVEGLNSLRSAIGLARELGVFDEYRDQIYEAAVTLSALHDAPVVAAWHDEKIEGSLATISFNGDLSEYVLGDYREGKNCQVYHVVGSTTEMIEQIQLGHACLGRIRFSSDGQLICCWTSVGKGKIALWVHDRQSNKSYLLDEHVNRSTGFGLQIRNIGKQVLYVNSDANLAIFDVANGTESTIDLPNSTHWQRLALSNDETRVAIFKIGVANLIVVDLNSHVTEAIWHGGLGIRSLAWRPDDRHLAIGTSKIQIWDLSRQMVCATLEQENTYVDRLNYGKDGRLLFSSGWLSRTEVHDVMAERRIFRCESIVSDVSDCGNFAAFFAGPNVQIRQVVTSKSILEFDYSRLHRQRYAGVDCATALLWLGPNFKISAYDLSTNRSLSTRSYTREGNFVAVDPKGRDFFVSADYRLHRMPVNPVLDQSEFGRAKVEKIQIGPPELLMESDDRQHLTVNNILLDSTGNRLGVDSSSSNHATVLAREQDWKAIAGKESRLFPTAVSPHPSLPLLVTNSHAADGFEVYNWETDSVLLSLPYKVAFTNFSPDGSRLLVQSGGRLRVFEVGSWQCLATSEPRFSPGDNPPVLSSDSQWIALQTQDPRGVAILDADSLDQVLFFRGHHLDPDSFVGSFDATGRFLVANHGQKVIAAWDLYKLKRHFESLDLEWPLPGLGNPTPLRDPNVEVEIVWESNETEPARSDFVGHVRRAEIGRWGRDWMIAPDYYVQQVEDWVSSIECRWAQLASTFVVQSIRVCQKLWLPD